eukprot:TRINITY_DN7404_c0_g2_i2.p1 TRINITY_DN7404_c0_g2~~TRINITY_DN7404_c0_g2_i2.p1  ORF type:complete len:258 (+),score=26.50 TRINITY_DN7404_c0_g2_i2:63-776(+)
MCIRDSYWYRLFCACFHIFLLIWNMIQASLWYKPFTFLTGWGYITCGLFFIFAVIEYLQTKRIKETFRNMDRSTSLAFVSKTTIILFQIAYSLQLPIMLMFWGYIYPRTKVSADFKFSVFTVFTHGLVCALIYIDFFFNKIRFYLRHLGLLVGFLVLYGVSNYLTMLARGVPAYSALTWNSMRSVYIVVATLSIAVLHFLFGWFIFAKCKKGKREGPCPVDIYAKITFQLWFFPLRP